MAVMEAGSAAHRRAVAGVEGQLGPFQDPAWRDDLALLARSVHAGALLMARDCEAIVSLAAQVPRSPGDERGGTPWTSFVREVAVAKKISDQAAHAEIALSERLLEDHPVLLAALFAGRTPPHRARVLVQECARYADPVAAVADRLLTDRLADLPPWRIRQEVTLLALRLDPAGAARREAAATAGRGARLTPLPDAQSEVVLTGPAPLVQRWWDALTAQARALKAAGDPRSLTALRFDLAVHTDPRGLLGHDPLSEAVGIAHPAGSDPAPADGPEPTATDQPTPEPPTAERPTSESPTAEPPTSEPPTSEPPTSEPPTPTPPSAPAPAPGPGLGLGVALRGDARCSRPVQAGITVPAATVLGLCDEPGWLDGYGWVSAPLARNLITVAELRKACVAPHSGQLIDLADRVQRPPTTPTGIREAVRRMVLTPHDLRPAVTQAQSRHDPSPALESFVQARDRWCDGPTGAQVRAAHTDTDHELPYPTGPTAAWNLTSRSARTHQLKHAGWTPARDAHGTTWTSPAGQTAVSPRFDHRPPAPPPGAAMPDPDQLAARDQALVRVHDWPDTSDWPDNDVGLPAERPPDAQPSDRADEPPF